MSFALPCACAFSEVDWSRHSYSTALLYQPTGPSCWTALTAWCQHPLHWCWFVWTLSVTRFWGKQSCLHQVSCFAYFWVASCASECWVDSSRSWLNGDRLPHHWSGSNCLCMYLLFCVSRRLEICSSAAPLSLTGCLGGVLNHVTLWLCQTALDVCLGGTGSTSTAQAD